MAETLISCPKCKHEFPLNEALTKEIESSIRSDYETKLQEEKDRLEEAAEEGRKAAEKALQRTKLDLEAKVRKELEFQNSVEIKDLKADLEAKTKALEDANEKELQHRKQVRELEDKARNAELEADRKLESERAAIIEKAAKDADIAHQLKDLEKDTKIATMLTQIEELKRKAEQGSQKMQGEVFEVKLQETLQGLFSFDQIEEVAPGVKGGDILQTVNTRSGLEVGKILWELKRTKSFSESWLAKLKADGRACKADICLLVSEALPEDITGFAERQGVWVCSIESCIPLVFVLRAMLTRVASERSIQTGKKEKSELVYEYITSVEFRGRIEAIIEAFRAMKDDLDSEKRATEKMFAKREKQIQQVVLNIAGMHGDLEALAGNALPQIKILELPEK